MFIELDIGATKTRVTASKDYNSLSDPIIIPTNFHFAEAMQEIHEAIKFLTRNQRIEAAAGGVRALDKNKESLINHPRIPLWAGEPLHRELQSFLDCPLFLENDALMAALGEANFGLGKGVNEVGYLTISSGVGGARISRGMFDDSPPKYEPGAQVISFEQDEPIYLSNLISGSALERKYGVKAEFISDPLVWDQVSKTLSLGINNVAALWMSEIIILGGGVTKRLNIDLVREYTYQIYKASEIQPVIVKSVLEDQSGLYGCLAYLKQKFSLD